MKQRRADEKRAELASYVAAGLVRESDLPACHVCGERVATVGMGPRPLLCHVCARA